MNIKISKLFLILTALLFIAIYFIYFTINIELVNDSESKIRFEIIKSLLSIVSVAIIGGVVSQLFKTYEANREKTKLRVEAKIDFMKKLGELYRIIKSSRRKLYANGIKKDYTNFAMGMDKEQVTVYILEMEAMNNVQLELEGLVIAVQNFNLFSYDSKVSGNLSIMELYLRNLLEEYESRYLDFKSQDYFDIKKLPKLERFTSKDEGDGYNEFKKEFSGAYYQILRHLS